MSKASRFLKNTAATVATKGLPPVLSLLIIVMIARILGVERLGEYTFITTLFMIFQVVGSMSFNFLLTREMAKANSKVAEIYGSSAFLGIILSIIFIVISGGAVSVLDYSPDVITANWILCLGLLPCFWMSINEAVFMAEQRNEVITLVTLMENLIRVGLCVAAILMGYGLVALAIILSLSRVFAAFAGYAMLKKKQLLSLVKVDLSIALELVRHVPSFIVIYSLAIVFLSTDVLMLSKMKSSYEVGIYSSAIKVANFFKIFPDSVMVVLYPLLSEAFQNDRGMFQILSARSLQYIVILLLPLALLVTILAGQIIPLLFSAEYAAGVSTLQILAWTMVASAGHSLLGNTLMAAGYQNKILKIMIVATLMNICLNVLFIPKYSYNGAAMATLVSSCFLVILCFYNVAKHLCKINLKDVLLKPFLCIGITGVLAWYINNTAVILAVLVVLCIYPLALWLSGALKKDDVDFVKNMMKLRFQSSPE